LSDIKLQDNDNPYDQELVEKIMLESSQIDDVNDREEAVENFIRSISSRELNSPSSRNGSSQSKRGSSKSPIHMSVIAERIDIVENETDTGPKGKIALVNSNPDISNTNNSDTSDLIENKSDGEEAKSSPLKDVNVIEIEDSTVAPTDINENNKEESIIIDTNETIIKDKNEQDEKDIGVEAQNPNPNPTTEESSFLKYINDNSLERNKGTHDPTSEEVGISHYIENSTNAGGDNIGILNNNIERISTNPDKDNSLEINTATQDPTTEESSFLNCINHNTTTGGDNDDTIKTKLIRLLILIMLSLIMM
jgi:hypothetical protein